MFPHCPMDYSVSPQMYIHCVAGPTEVHFGGLCNRSAAIGLSHFPQMLPQGRKEMVVGHSCAWWVPQRQSWELPKPHPLHSECPWLLHSRAGFEAARWALQYSESEVLLVFLRSQAVNRKHASSVTSAETYLSHFRVESK